MRFLVLSLYYRPDLSAGSFRATALVESLRRQMPAGSHIDVLTSLPNRYASFPAVAPELEHEPDLTIRRFALARHEGGTIDQSFAFAHFARQVRSAVRAERYDVVFATSSRLMTAVLGAHVAARCGARFFLDIRDIFADTIKDVLRGPAGRLAGLVSSRLERYAVGRAHRVNLVSAGFLEYFRRRYPETALSCITNGIDDEFCAAAPTERRASPRKAGPEVTRMVYAGNVGEGQGLEHIVPQLAGALKSRIHIIVIGDGGRRRALEEAVSLSRLPNVEVRAPVGRADLTIAYRDADVLFLHLNDHAAFLKVLPSKIFEYAAMGKPILAGVAGYAAEFLRSEVPNSAVFAPCDVEGAVRALATLTLEDAPRVAFLASYARSALSAQLADEVIAAGGSTDRHRG